MMATLCRQVKGLLGVLLASTACVALAVDRPVKVIVPFAAGGPADRVARELVLAMSGYLDQPMMIVNVAGAGGTIGARKAARAAKDGSVVLLHHMGMSAISALYPDLGFEPLRAYEYIGRIADVPMVLVATGSLPPLSDRELGSYLRIHGVEVVIANAGTGSASHLCGLMLMRSMQQELTMIPYQGTAPALTALLGGHVQLLCDQAINVRGLVQANRLKAYGVTANPGFLPFGTMSAFPGLGGDVELKVWYAMYAPRGTKKRAVDRLAKALQATVRDETFRARMIALGAEVVAPSAATPEGLRRHLEIETRKWQEILDKTDGGPG